MKFEIDGIGVFESSLHAANGATSMTWCGPPDVESALVNLESRFIPEPHGSRFLVMLEKSVVLFAPRRGVTFSPIS